MATIKIPRYCLVVSNERTGRTKLTDAQVAEIRALCGTLSQREIASMYGVSENTVHRIKVGLQRKIRQPSLGAIPPAPRSGVQPQATGTQEA